MEVHFRMVCLCYTLVRQPTKLCSQTIKVTIKVNIVRTDALQLCLGYFSVPML